MTMQVSEKLACTVANNEAGLYDVVYFYGAREKLAGRVDTVVAKIGETQPEMKIFRTQAAPLVDRWISNIQKGYGKFMPDCDLFILEEVQKMAGKESMEQELYFIFDRFLESHRRLIITGNVPTAQMLPLAERIRAQIDGGVAFCLE